MQLGKLGYRTLEAENVAAAIAILEGRERIDLLFADVVMPGKLDGYDLARTARERWPAVKIVLTAGFPGNNRDAKPPAGVPLLTKPYRREALAPRAARRAQRARCMGRTRHKLLILRSPRSGRLEGCGASVAEAAAIARRRRA